MTIIAIVLSSLATLAFILYKAFVPWHITVMTVNNVRIATVSKGNQRHEFVKRTSETGPWVNMRTGELLDHDLAVRANNLAYAERLMEDVRV